MSRRRSFALTATVLAAVLGLGACGSDSDKASSTAATTAATSGAPTTVATPPTEPATTVAGTEAPSTEPATSEPTTEPASTVPDSTEPSTTEPETTVAPTTTVPDAISQLPGVSPLDATIGGTDATRPTFTWTPPANATSYQLLVQSADGVPLWAWTGAETSVVLGGVERPADVEGPTLTGPSRVRVYAFDAAFMVVAVSGWVAAPGA